MEYFLLKWVHIISSTILFGTGIGSAFYMFVANRSKNIHNIYFATKYVVIADFIFTTPAVIIQLITGLWLLQVTGYNFQNNWVIIGFLLYLFAGACWLPVVFMQIKMRDMAKISLETNKELPDSYWKMDKWWIALGLLAFPAIVIIFWLMVAKP